MLSVLSVQLCTSLPIQSYLKVPVTKHEDNRNAHKIKETLKLDESKGRKEGSDNLCVHRAQEPDH